MFLFVFLPRSAILASRQSCGGGSGNGDDIISQEGTQNSERRKTLSLPEDLRTQVKGVKVKATQLCPTLCDPMDYTVHGILQARILEWVALPCSRGSSHPGIEPRSPALQTGSLPAELPGKPKNAGVGSLSLLQRIFLTQELNQGLLHCRQILYQLSYQGSP